MAPFYYGWGSTASRLQPLRGGSLLFIIRGARKKSTTKVHEQNEEGMECTQ